MRVYSSILGAPESAYSKHSNQIFSTVSVEVQNIIERCCDLVSNRGIQNFNISSELGTNDLDMIRIANGFVTESILGLNLLWTSFRMGLSSEKQELLLTSWMAS